MQQTMVNMRILRSLCALGESLYASVHSWYAFTALPGPTCKNCADRLRSRSYGLYRIPALRSASTPCNRHTPSIMSASCFLPFLHKLSTSKRSSVMRASGHLFTSSGHLSKSQRCGSCKIRQGHCRGCAYLTHGEDSCVYAHWQIPAQPFGFNAEVRKRTVKYLFHKFSLRV